MNTEGRYERTRQELIKLISRAEDHGDDGWRPRLNCMVLNNKQAAAVLKMAPAKVSQIPLSDLPRVRAKGKGGVKITVIAVVDYLMREAGFDEPAKARTPSGSARLCQRLKYTLMELAFPRIQGLEAGQQS